MNDRPTSPQPAPVEPGARIQVIDVLRGFALLGVLVMNMAGYTGSYETMERWTQLDQWLNWAAHFLFEAKFYSLFSFLFGLGMAMQLLRAEARGTRFMPVYLRRLFILLLIGMAHATFLWTGDILFIYACCGFLLLLFRKLPPKTILIGALLVLLHPIIISLPHVSPAFYEAFGRATEGLRAMIPGDEQIYTTGTYFQVTMHRFWEANMGRLVIAFAFGNVFAMFLLGLFAGRQKIFQRLAEHLPLIRRVMWVTLVLGVLLNGLYVYFIIHPDYVAEDWQPLARRGLRTVAAPSLCLFYISAIILLYQSQTWRLRLDDLAPLGRMALTNYLLQSLVMTTIFYGYGLGIYGEFGPTGDLVLALIFYGLQIRFSAWWLERYRFGPAEWAWRSLTYGRLQPWRADVEAGQAVPARPKVALAAIAVLLPLGFILWRGWQALPQEEQAELLGHLPVVGPTATLAPPRPRPTPTPTRVSTPAVEPVSRRPQPAAAQGDLWELALAFDPELAQAEIETLTGPPYLGRAAGSPGGQAAGEYIARRFAEYGLRPAGPDGAYFQPFPIAYTRLSAMPELAVSGPNGLNRTYRVRQEFAPMVGRYLGGGQADGPVIWTNECGQADFDYLDVVGKVVLCWDRLLRERYEDVGRNALEHGAAGLLLLADPEEEPFTFDRLGPYREVWVPQPIPGARISPELAQDLLAGAGLTLDDLTLTLAPFPLSTTVRLEVPLQTDESALGRNVLGVLPGRDPDYRDELVILGAHYDHMGEDPDGTAWPGANDNASGTAVLLEIARSWQAQGYTPRRTVLFAAWDAEELGLLGSRHYVLQPQYSISDTVAMLQLDMVGAGEDTLYLDGESTLTAKLNSIAATLGLSTTVTRHGGSDHSPFLEAHIPAALLIWAGMETTEATAHYHRPLDRPAIIEPAKLAAAGRVANLALLAQVEGEPDLEDLLQARIEAVETGDLETFLETGTPARRTLDSAWFAQVQRLNPSRLELDPTGLRVAGRVATATVWLEVAARENLVRQSSYTARLPVRFVHQGGGWRWDGPALVWQQPLAAWPVAYPPEVGPEALALSRLAGQRYAHLARQLGLPPDSQASLVLYPDSQALRADTRLTLPAGVEAVVDIGGDHPPLVKLVYTPHLSQTQALTGSLVQLALAEVGLAEEDLPWLWQGLPMAIHAGAQPVAAQKEYLPGLSEALGANAGGGHASPLVSGAEAWAAVEYLREQIGWAGIGRLALTLGEGASPDEALTGLVGMDQAEFESMWRTAWQNRLRQAETRLAASLAAREIALMGADEDAFLATIDPAAAPLLAEEQAWFKAVTARPPEHLALTGRPIALLADGSLLAQITMSLQPAGQESEISQSAAIRFVPAPNGYRWAGPPVESMATEQAVIHYPAGYAPLAQALLPEFSTAWRQITTDLGLESDQVVTIKLYDEPAAFRLSIAGVVPDWIQSWTGAGQSIKLLVDDSGDSVAYRQPLARELTRQLLLRPADQAGWLAQGLALYEAGRLSRAEARQIFNRYWPLVGRALRTKKLFPLAEPPLLANLSGPEAELAKAQSWDMVRTLIDRYGRTDMQALLDRLQAGQDLPPAFREIYGLTLAEFESDWQAAAARGHARANWVDLARTFDVTTVQATIAELTGPEYAGRAPGLPGEAAAAAYLADQFAAYGLSPAGAEQTYFQPFPITYTVLSGAPRLLALNETGQPVAALRYREEFGLIQTGATGGGRVEAEVIWLNGEDYGPARLAGKLVVRELRNALEPDIEQAIAHGAGGLILVGTRKDKELRPKALRSEEPDPQKEEIPVERRIPVVELTPDGFERLLATAGYTPAELKASPTALPLKMRVRLEVPTEVQRLTSANVLGLLPGSDPELRDEVVIIAAHYDHVGDDPDDRVCLSSGGCLALPGYSYPGANDDASALGMMLEIARLWQSQGYRPARTVLFAAWGGQELAQAGSRHYVDRPTLPLTQTVALLQLEAVGGGRGFRLQLQGDRQREAALRFLLEAAAGQVEARVTATGADLSSDQEAFQWLGTPAMLIRWEKAETDNLPAEFDDEIDPDRLAQTGRTLTLTAMMLAQ